LHSEGLWWKSERGARSAPESRRDSEGLFASAFGAARRRSTHHAAAASWAGEYPFVALGLTRPSFAPRRGTLPFALRARAIRRTPSPCGLGVLPTNASSQGGARATRRPRQAALGRRRHARHSRRAHNDDDDDTASPLAHRTRGHATDQQRDAAHHPAAPRATGPVREEGRRAHLYPASKDPGRCRPEGGKRGGAVKVIR